MAMTHKQAVWLTQGGAAGQRAAEVLLARSVELEKEVERVHAELTEVGEKFVSAQREVERLRARVAELEVRPT